MSMETPPSNKDTAHPTTFLPKEVTALIHHIELNKAGWWDRAAQRLVIASIWLANEPLSTDQVSHNLETQFRLKLSGQKLVAVLATLEKQNFLVKLPGDVYRIPDAKRTEFEREVDASEQAEQRAHKYFVRLVQDQKLSIDTQVAWATFNDKFLAPLINEVGANAYRLVTGQNTLDGVGLVGQFLSAFPPDQHTRLGEVASRFLNPKSDDARSYISRLLHARLCVEASGLPEAIVAKLRDSAGKPIRFRVFVDTNFLFSLMDLHENPSNETAKELQDLIAHLKSNLKIELYIAPKTVEEAKTALLASKSQLSGIPSSSNFTTVALHAGLSGMAQKFLTERWKHGKFITAEEWFRPYVDNFVAIAKGKGIELYNENQDSLSTQQEVLDDIVHVMDFEKKLPEQRRKSYDRVEHDMVLWHFVRGKRMPYVESPIDARDWILTVDFRFIGFDQHKLRQENAKIPVCLHPTSLIQLLQFWVPRTKEFEEAMLGSLRLPFLFQEFDADAERTTLKILRGLGRFEGSSDLPEATISSVIMNDGLRAVLASEHSGEEEVALIRDALLEEQTRRIEAEKAKAQQLEATIQSTNATLSAMEHLKKTRDQEIETLRAELSEKQSLMEAAGKQNESQATIIANLKAKSESRNALIIYLFLLVAVLGISALSGWVAALWLTEVVKIVGYIATVLIFAVLTFVLGHLSLEISCRKYPAMHNLWPFVQATRFRKWLWSLVVLGFMLGVIGNLVANIIQKNIDNEQQHPSTEVLPPPPDDPASVK
jgi:hypothetical protein